MIQAGGTVLVWGGNTYGQTNVPNGLSNVVAIAAGGWHNLALKSNGKVTASIREIQTLDGAYWEAFPRCRDFMARMAARPAFQRAMQTTMPNGPPSM